MIIKTGWQNDFGKQKFDIELNETDLQRILTDADIPPDVSLTSTEAFRLLLAVADQFSETVRAAKTQDEDALGEASAAIKRRQDMVARVKARLGHDVRSGIA